MSGSAAQQQDSPFSILVGCVKIPASTIAGILNRPCTTQASALSTALDATSPVPTDPALRVLINAAISIFEDEKQVVLELTTLLKGLTQGVAESGSTLTTSTTPKTVMASDSGFNVIGSSGVSVNIGPVSTTQQQQHNTQQLQREHAKEPRQSGRATHDREPCGCRGHRASLHRVQEDFWGAFYLEDAERLCSA
jgi:hypothetical protein